jgi:phenylacetate-coenzyme A ligase PaaK-like adenylate-forming protein
LPTPKIKAIIVTAEVLQPKYRERIERVFQRPVFNNYGSNDGGVQPYKCKRHEDLHYNDLQSILHVEKAMMINMGIQQMFYKL